MSEDAAPYVGRLSPDGKWRWDGSAWVPADPGPHPPPAWAGVAVRKQATWWVVAAALIVGLVTDQALRVGAFGLGASTVLASAALALVLIARLERLESRLPAAAAVVFGAWLSLRASPWLVWP